MRWQPTQARGGRQWLESPLPSQPPSTCSGAGGGLGCPTGAWGSEAGRARSRLRPPTGAKGTLLFRVTGICLCFLHQMGALLRHSFIHSLIQSLSCLLSLTSYCVLGGSSNRAPTCRDGRSPQRPPSKVENVATPASTLHFLDSYTLPSGDRGMSLPEVWTESWAYHPVLAGTCLEQPFTLPWTGHSITPSGWQPLGCVVHDLTVDSTMILGSGQHPTSYKVGLWSDGMVHGPHTKGLYIL